jgi:hypothetical protein
MYKYSKINLNNLPSGFYGTERNVAFGDPFYRESRGIALLCFLDLGTRRKSGVSVTPRLLSTPGKDPVPIVQEAGWTPGPV